MSIITKFSSSILSRRWSMGFLGVLRVHACGGHGWFWRFGAFVWRAHGGIRVWLVGKIDEEEENEEKWEEVKKRGWFWERFRDWWWWWWFRFCHAIIWKKRPPPNSPQGFNIHQPAPRLRREGKNNRGRIVERDREIIKLG